MPERMKREPDHENETRDLSNHVDLGQARITPLLRLDPVAALAIVTTLAELVTHGHQLQRSVPIVNTELQRAQVFEEGNVYMIEPPFEGFFADRYLMAFYDVRTRNLCSRMHFHTGLRFVRMMTGPQTTIRVSSLSPFHMTLSPRWEGDKLECFTDELVDVSLGVARDRFNALVPPNAWVDLQIPRGVSHQFNADGPHAVIDSVHPEESLETLREEMTGYKMMAQTIFLAEEKSPASSCLDTSRPG